jgi:hypothetical protein
MDVLFSPFADSIISNFTKEIKKKKNKEKIMNNIIDPLLKDISTRYYPYLVTITCILIIIILLLISILILLVIQKCSLEGG